MTAVFAARKIVAALVLLLTGVGVTYLRGDIPPNLLSLMQVLFGAFVLGNGIEHFTTMKIAQSNGAATDVKTQ